MQPLLLSWGTDTHLLQFLAIHETNTPTCTCVAAMNCFVLCVLGATTTTDDKIVVALIIKS